MLSRRGRLVAGIGVVAVAMAATFSPRSLNAVVAPIAVALVAGVVQLHRIDRPELSASVPEYGFSGEETPIAFDFATERPFSAVVTVAADDGLRVTDGRREIALANTTLAFDVRLARRGEHRVGSVSVIAEDVLGLCRREFSYRITDEIVVFPQIHELDEVAEFETFYPEQGPAGRDRFGQLREYERGDPLRNVDWKSSAKRTDDELVVVEFDASEETRRVEIAVDAAGGPTDDVADAAASVAAYLLDRGLAVGLTAPKECIEPETGDEHRTRVLTLLARLSGRKLRSSYANRAGVVVRGVDDRVEVEVGGRTLAFDRLTETERQAAGGEPAAPRTGGGS